MSRPARDSDDPTQFRELFSVSGVDTGLADLAFSRRPCTCCWRSFQDSSAYVVVDGNGSGGRSPRI